MSESMYILAEIDFTRLIIFAAVVAFWLIGWAIKAASNLAEQQRRRQALDRIGAARDRSLGQETSAPRARPPGTAVPPAIPQQQSWNPIDLVEELRRRAEQPETAMPYRATPPPPRQVKQARGARQKKVAPAPPPVPAAPRVQPVSAPMAPVHAAALSGSAAAGPAGAVSAGAIAKWLRPETLRRQFILTEVFQPPLSMRESRER